MVSSISVTSFCRSLAGPVLFNSEEGSALSQLNDTVRAPAPHAGARVHKVQPHKVTLQRDVGVAAQQNIGLDLPGRRHRQRVAHLYPVPVSVRHEDAPSLHQQDPLVGYLGKAVAVAAHVLHGLGHGQALPKGVKVPAQVPQVEDQVGLLPGRRPRHGVHIPVGVGQDQQLLHFGHLRKKVTYNTMSPVIS